jgi:hypothetical protein
MTASPNSPDILQKLISLTQATYKDRNYHIACPNCKKSPKGKQSYGHFSFNARGGHCFACGYSCSLQRLYFELSGINIASSAAPVLDVPTPSSRHWQQSPQSYLDRYVSHPDRVKLWQDYRPFTLANISRFDLGVGVLPSSKCKHPRLILPIRQNGQLVSFRGRRIDCECDKWLCPGGSSAVLFGADRIVAGCDLIIIEAPIGCLFSQQIDPSFVVVAGTSGAGTWKAEWTALIKAARIRRALIWLDNDLAGDPNKETRDRLLAKWRAEHPQAKYTPQSNGPKIARQLAQAGVPVARHAWPNGTPDHADFDWHLMRGL